MCISHSANTSAHPGPQKITSANHGVPHVGHGVLCVMVSHQKDVEGRRVPPPNSYPLN